MADRSAMFGSGPQKDRGSMFEGTGKSRTSLFGGSGESRRDLTGAGDSSFGFETPALANTIGFASSFLSSFPELLGMEASPDIKAWRAQHPIGNFGSQALGFLVPYTAGAKALRAASSTGKVIEGAKTFGRARGGAALGTSLEWGTEAAMLEGGRLALSTSPLGETLFPQLESKDAGEELLFSGTNIIGGLALGGVVGSVGARLAQGVKLHHAVPGADPALPPHMRLQALLEKRAEPEINPKLAERIDTEVRRLEKAKLTDAEVVTTTTGESYLTGRYTWENSDARFYREVVGDSTKRGRTLGKFLDTVLRPRGRKESAFVAKLPVRDSQHGLGQQELDELLGKLGMSQEQFARLAVNPRVVEVRPGLQKPTHGDDLADFMDVDFSENPTVAPEHLVGTGRLLQNAERKRHKTDIGLQAIKTFERRITENKAFSYIGDGFYMAREKDGMFVLAKKVVGEQPAGVLNEIAQIEDDFRESLIAAGIGKNQAKNLAALRARSVMAKAEKLGITPGELWKTEQKQLTVKMVKELPDFMARNQLAMFVGEKAALLPKIRKQLISAWELDAQGVSNEVIRKQTGWFRGLDGEWKLEISDHNAQFIEPKLDDDVIMQNFLLKDVLKHDELYKAYPELEDMLISVRGDLPDGVGGLYHPSTKSISVRADMPKAEIKNTILHELQHYIQELEGFSSGASTRSMARHKERYMMALGDVMAAAAAKDPAKALRKLLPWMNEKHAEAYATVIKAGNLDARNKLASWVNYARSAGEMEARLVERRAAMTPAQRAKAALAWDVDPTKLANTHGGMVFENTATIGTKGMIEFDAEGAAVISLVKGADANVVLHEMAHYWLRDMIRMGDSGVAKVLDDLDILREWLGVRDWKYLTRDQEERFARAFQVYMWEGNAPNKQLDGVFAQIKKWVRKAYMYAIQLGVEIHPQVMGVFDNLLNARVAETAKVTDRWIVLRTADPQQFAKGSGLAQAEVLNSAYFPEVPIGKKIGEELFDTLADYERANFAKVRELAGGGTEIKSAAGSVAKEAAEGLATLVAPSAPLFSRNVKANYIFQMVKSMQALVDGKIDVLLYGSRKFLEKGRHINEVMTFAEPKTAGLADAIKTFSKEELSEISEILQAEVPFSDVLALYERGVVSENAFKLLSTLDQLDQSMMKRYDTYRANLTNVDLEGMMEKFTSKAGHYGLTREYQGAFRVLLEDEAGEIVGIAAGRTAGEARDKALTLIEQEAAKGKTIRELGMMNELLKNEEIFYKLRSATQRPYFMRSRGKMIGYEAMQGELTAEKLISMIQKNLTRRENFLSEMAIREKTWHVMNELSTEEPTIHAALEKRLRMLHADEGAFGEMQNRWMDKITAGLFGKDSASAIVKTAQQSLSAFQFGFGNLAHPILNMTAIFQNLLPEIAYITHASPQARARNYISLPIFDGKSHIVGSLGVLSEVKLMRNALRLVFSQTDQLPRDYKMLFEEMIRRKMISPRYAEEHFGVKGGILSKPMEAFKSGRSFVEFAKSANEVLVSKSEELNRLVTVAAAYELSKLIPGMNFSRMVHFTEEMMGKVAFNYGTIDRALVFTTPLGSLMGTFKNWMFHYMGNMLKYAGGGREAMPALLWQTAATAAIGGAAATPFAIPLADAASKWFTDQSFMESVYDLTGMAGVPERIGDSVLYGLPGMLGVSFATQAAAPGSDPSRDASMLFSFAAWDRVKALSNATKDALTHYSATGESPFGSAEVQRELVRGLAPRTLFRAYSASQDEAIKSLSTGYTVMDDVSMGSALLYSMGFNQTELEKTYKVYGAIRDDQRKARALVQEYGKAVAQAWDSGDNARASQILTRALAVGVDPSSVLRSAESRRARNAETQLEFATKNSPDVRQDWSFMFN